MRVLRHLICALPVVLLVSSIAASSDPPDSEVNTKNGRIEIVDAVSQISGLDVRHLTNPGEGEPPIVVIVSQSSLNDVSPKLAIGSDGDTWVTWWRDGATDEVFVRKKSYATGAWDAELRVSSLGESSRHPAIVTDGDDAWVAYEFDSGAQTAIAVNIIHDEPEPFGIREVIATTSFAGDADVLAHSVSGALWVTWVDSSAEVGWSEYDYAAGIWSIPDYESYASDDVTSARSRIHNVVTGP